MTDQGKFTIDASALREGADHLVELGTALAEETFPVPKRLDVEQSTEVVEMVVSAVGVAADHFAGRLEEYGTAWHETAGTYVVADSGADHLFTGPAMPLVQNPVWMTP